MQDKRYILCGNTSIDKADENPDNVIRLRLWGNDGPDKITLRIEDIHKKMLKEIPAEFQDLLEIATYVYSGDQAVPRGSNDVDSFGENWRRSLHFVIPVRNPKFWNSREVNECLRSTLGFLSDDHYQFDFVKLRRKQPFQGYLDLNEDGSLLGKPEQVVMFSGGLDSLGGAVEEVLNQKRRVVLEAVSQSLHNSNYNFIQCVFLTAF